MWVLVRTGSILSNGKNKMIDISVSSLFNNYKESLIKCLNSIEIDKVELLINKLEKMSQQGSSLFILGNGGSAATASHFANDLFALNLKYDFFNLKAHCLTDNHSIVTALANDQAFSEVFTQQLKVMMKPDDAILVLSASGNSPNLVEAAKWANKQGNSVLSILGFDGGEVLELSDISIHFQTQKNEYEKSEDLHLFINHFLRVYFQSKLDLKQS